MARKAKRTLEDVARLLISQACDMEPSEDGKYSVNQQLMLTSAFSAADYLNKRPYLDILKKQKEARKVQK